MVIADTGFWLALADRRDEAHALARTRLDALDEALVTTWPVVTETCHGSTPTRLGIGSRPALKA